MTVSCYCELFSNPLVNQIYKAEFCLTNSCFLSGGWAFFFVSLRMTLDQVSHINKDLECGMHA